MAEPNYEVDEQQESPTPKKGAFSPKRPSKARESFITNLARAWALGQEDEDSEAQLGESLRGSANSHAFLDKAAEDVYKTYYGDVDEDEFKKAVGYDAYEDERPGFWANLMRRAIERVPQLVGAEMEVTRQGQVNSTQKEYDAFARRQKESNPKATDAEIDAAWDEQAKGLNEMRGMLGVSAGTPRLLTAAVLRDQSADKEHVAKAREFDIGGETMYGVDDMYRSPGNFVAGAVEAAGSSIADMAFIFNAPALLPYTKMRASEIALERAASDNRDKVSTSDMLIAAPTAAVVSAFDKVGLTRLLGKRITGDPSDMLFRTKTGAKKATGEVAGEIAKRLGTESGTEAVQEIIEYAAATTGTETGFDAVQALKMGGVGAAAGMIMAGTVTSVSVPIEYKKQMKDGAGVFLTDEETTKLEQMVPKFAEDNGMAAEDAFVALSDAYRLGRHVAKEVDAEFEASYEELSDIHKGIEAVGSRALAEEQMPKESAMEAGGPPADAADLRQRMDYPLVENIEADPMRWDEQAIAISEQVATGERSKVSPVDVQKGDRVVVMKPDNSAPVGAVVEETAAADNIEGNGYVRIKDDNGGVHTIVPALGRNEEDIVLVTPNPATVKADEAAKAKEEGAPDYSSEARRVVQGLQEETTEDGLKQLEKLRSKEAWWHSLDDEQRTWVDKFIRQQQDKIAVAKAAEKEAAKPKPEKSPAPEKPAAQAEPEVAAKPEEKPQAEPDAGLDTEEAALDAIDEELGDVISEASRESGDAADGTSGVGVTRAAQAAREDMASVLQAAAVKQADKVQEPLGELGFEQLATSEVVIDAEQFQFKKSDKRGKTGRLDEVEKWSPAAAGIITVFRDTDGKNYVVDGHQRVNLAKELEGRGHPPIKLDVRVLDGSKMSADEARLYGAVLNIGQGSGTAIDAANVLKSRSMTEQMDMQKQFKGANMRHGASLAKMEPEAFDLYEGHFNNAPGAPAVAPNIAAAIGDHVPKDTPNRAETQVAILKDMIESPPSNAAEAAEFVKEFVYHAQESAGSEQTGMFGADIVIESALRERAKIKAGVVRGARQNAKVFKSLAENKMLVESIEGNVVDAGASMNAAERAKVIQASIDTQAHIAGSPIAESLSRLAMSVKSKEASLNEAINEFRKTIEAAGAPGVPKRKGDQRRKAGDRAEQAAAKEDALAVAEDPDAAALDALADDLGFDDQMDAAEIDDISASLFESRVFHSSPSRGIKQFETDRAGSGVGMEVYGYGTYLADDSPEADAYFASARKKGGAQYKVDLRIPKNRLLSWEQPIHAQPRKARKLLNEMIKDYGLRRRPSQTIEELYQSMAEIFGSTRSASKALSEYGLGGHKYRQWKNPDKHNYVIYEPEHTTKILEERHSRADEVQELEAAVADISAMDEKAFREFVKGFVGELSALAQKRKGGEHLTASESVLLARSAKLHPFVRAELDRRKGGGEAIAKKEDTDLAKALAFLKSTDEAVDEAIAADIDISEHIQEDTAKLLDVGNKHGIPAAVTRDQAADAAAIVESFKENRNGFILALPTGSGKTFVMAAALRELRRLRTPEGKRAVNRIVYVTMNRGLIKQAEDDFSPYMKGIDGAPVKFITYTKLGRRDDADVARLIELMDRTEGSVLVLDESHNVKGQTARTSTVAKRMMEGSDFTIASSATPFASPMDVHYFAPSGAFEDMGGFDEWAKTHGVTVSQRVTEEGHVYPSYSAEKVEPEDIQAARVSMMQGGHFSYRPQRLDPANTELQFIDAPISDLKSPGMRALYAQVFIAGESALRTLRTESARSGAAMWLKNSMKRIAEQAKIQSAIDLAEKALAGPGKPQVIIFTETRSPATIGKWRYSRFFEPDDKIRQERTFTYRQMEPMQAAAAAADQPRPFSASIFELARRFDESGIYVNLPSVLDAFKEKFGDQLVEYNGTVTPELREVNKQLFNTGKKRVLLATIKAGGTGLSLHDTEGNAPRTVIPLSLPWTAIEFSQMLGRATRYGMKSKVDIQIPYAANLSVEQVVAVRQARRAAQMGMLVAGKTPQISGRIRDMLEGEEEIAPESEAGPLNGFIEAGKIPEGYNDGQADMARGLRRILRLGQREDSNDLADVWAWSKEMGDQRPLDAEEREEIGSNGLGGFLRVQRRKVLSSLLDMANQGQVDAALEVIDHLESYLATRGSSDFDSHSDAYAIDVKGTTGDSLPQVMRDFLNESRRQVTEQATPKFNQESPAWRYLMGPKVWNDPTADAHVMAQMGDIIAGLKSAGERMTGGRVNVEVMPSHWTTEGGSVVRGAYVPAMNRIMVALQGNREPMQILGHEIIHALRNIGVISDTDWEVLSRAAKANGWLNKYDIPRRYGDLSEDRQIEEAVAEEFGVYFQNREASSVLKQIWDRIVLFFKQALALLRGRGYSVNVAAELMFHEVASGQKAQARKYLQKQRMSADTAFAKDNDNVSVLPSQEPLSEYSEETRERWVDAQKGVDEYPLMARLNDARHELANHLTRTFGRLPKTAGNADLLNKMRLLRGSSFNAGVEAMDLVNQVTHDLDPEQVGRLNDAFAFEDLLWTHEQGMDIPFGMDQDLGDGRTPIERLLNATVKAKALVSSDPKLRERYDRRQKIREELRQRMLVAGILSEETARNPHYYRHQVLEYYRSIRRGGNRKLKSPKTYKRRGSIKDINLNYAQVEAEWMMTAVHDIAVQDFLNWLGDSKYNNRSDWAKRAKAQNNEIATKRLREELERADWAGAKHKLIQEAETPGALRQAVKKIAVSKPLPELEVIPMYWGYAKTASRLFGTSKVLENETRTFFHSPDSNTSNLPEGMRELMGRMQATAMEDEHGDAEFGDFPAFEVAAWSVRPDSGAPPGMKMAAAGFLKAAANRKKLLKEEILLGDYIDTTNTDQIRRAFDPHNEYKSWQPDAVDSTTVKLVIRNAKTIQERAYEQMLAAQAAEARIPPDVVAEWTAAVKNQRVVAQPTRMIIIHEDLAGTLDNFYPKPITTDMGWVVSKMNGTLRKWTLFNPKRVLPFNVNNVAGDVDAWMMNQSIDFARTLRVHLPQAFSLLREEQKTGEKSALIQAAYDQDVLQSSYVAQQIGQPGSQEVVPGGFVEKTKPRNVVGKLYRGYSDTVFAASRTRENAFRLAVYLNFREKFSKAGIKAENDAEENLKRLRGVVGYGSTPRYAREGLINDPEALIGRMARDAMGDYTDITEFGQQIDQGVTYFWRWVETNSRRNYNNIKNAVQLPYDSYRYDAAEKKKMYLGLAAASGTVAWGGAKMGMRAGYLYTKLTSFFFALALLDHGIGWAWRDEDEEEDRPRRSDSPVNPHVTLYKDKDKDAWVELRYQGAMRDFLRWFGFENAFFAAQDAYDGVGPWSDIPLEMLKGPINLLAGNVNMAYKAVGESLVGEKIWPDVFNPRAVGDRGEHITRTLSLDDEYKLLLGQKDLDDYAKTWLPTDMITRESMVKREQDSRDYNVERQANRALGKDQEAVYRKQLRNAVVSRNEAQMRQATVNMLGIMDESETDPFGKIVDMLRYIDPTFGTRSDVKAHMQADRYARGYTGAHMQRIGQYFSRYWQENQLTADEVKDIRQIREQWRERRQRYYHARGKQLQAKQKEAA